MKVLILGIDGMIAIRLHSHYFQSLNCLGLQEGK